MSHGNWLYVIAIGGCLTFTLSSGVRHAQNNSATPAQQPQQQKQAPTPPPIVEPQVAQPDYYKTSCETPKDHDAADLCEQRRMAKAAEDAVWWARAQTILGVLGFGVVIATLVFTAVATRAASRAAKAAEEAIIIENRPWIKFAVNINGNPTINGHGMTFSCQMKLTNVGNGPAKIIGVVTGELDFFADDLLAGLKEWIDEHIQIARKHPNEQETFFPNETYINQQFPRMSRTLFDQHIAVIPNHKMVNPVIIFGVFYKAAIGADIFYTVAAYNITMPDIERGRSRAIEIDESARLFTAEYAGQFDVFLPGIAALGLPVPLGGSSNHFRTASLREVGGWDAYNVTEDADLGMRLARFGYRSGVISSTTYEEAPARLRPWLRQRTRWFKGWMQTWLVHMREPRRLMRNLGLSGFLGFQLIVGGNVLAALVHPLFIGGLVYSMASGAPLWRDSGLAMDTVAALYGVTVAVGYLTSAFLSWLGLKRRSLLAIAWVLVLMPLHWLLLSLAAWRALGQLLVSPYVWEKTEHGLAKSSRRAARVTLALVQLERHLASLEQTGNLPALASRPINTSAERRPFRRAAA
jgi:Glycosyl transferase family group 2